MTEQEYNLPENERHALSEHCLTVSLFIHDKPESVFCDDETITAARITEYAAGLNASLTQLAETLATLEADGWTGQPAGYCVDLYHPNIDTARQARARLKKLGLNVKSFAIQDN